MSFLSSPCACTNLRFCTNMPPLPQAKSMMRPLKGSIISISRRTIEPGVKNCPAQEPLACVNLPM